MEQNRCVEEELRLGYLGDNSLPRNDKKKWGSGQITSHLAGE